MKNRSKFEEFERKVMEKLLDGEDDVLRILRDQYRNADIKNREFSGSGFFTTFDVPNGLIKLDMLGSFHFGDILGECDGVRDGVGFVLFVKNGAIDYLEGYTYGDDKWPDILEKYQLSYTSGVERDLDKIRAKWHLE